MKSPVYIYKKLNYLFNVEKTFTAGIMLEGWEARSLHEHCGNIDVAYCGFKNNNFYLMNAKITPLKHHLLNDKITVVESRDRILLLNKDEINKISSLLETRGWTCIPSRLYRNEKNLWKLEIAVVTGKKEWDRREDLKTRDAKREIKQLI